MMQTPPTSPDQLFDRLHGLGIPTRTVQHAPVFTVAEARALRGDLPGAHIKNLFLRNKKGRMWLVVVEESRAVDLKALGERLDAGRLSFGSPERLATHLGVTPGSVTPFALINDLSCRVTAVLDKTILEQDPVNCHPLTNDMTTAISPAGLLAFIRSTGREPQIVDLDTPPA